MANKKFLLLIVLSAIIFTGLIGAIVIVNTAPVGDVVTPNSTIQINYTIDASDGLKNITFSFNNTNYTFFDYQLLLWVGMNNFSTLGEYTNGSTEATCGFVRDLSMYNLNGTITGCNSTAGFVQENISFGSTFGHNSGGFNFSGNKAYIDFGTASRTSLNASAMEDITWCAWVNAYNNQTMEVAGMKHWNFRANSDFTWTLRINYTNIGLDGTDYTKGSYELNEWNFICARKDGANYSLYQNGIHLGSNNTLGQPKYEATNFKITATSGNFGFFNGSIDDVMVWNKSFTDNEISQLYNLQIIKYNSTYYNYNSTQTPLVYGQSSFLCSTNLTGDMFCSTTQTIRSANTIKSNFSDSSGIINESFYGTNVHKANRFIGSSRLIDTNYDGTSETISDTALKRQLFLNSGNKVIGLDMDLDQYYSNTSDASGVNLTTDLSDWVDLFEWLYENDKSVYLVVAYTPSWLADNSSGKCIDLNNCPPSNFTKFNNIALDFVDEITNHGEYKSVIKYFQFYNEPYNTFFMGGLAFDDPNHATNYTYFNNQTYPAFKLVYPEIDYCIGGGQIYTPNFWSAMIQSMGEKGENYDCIITHGYEHTYSSSLITNDTVELVLDLINDTCATYNKDCSRIIITEWAPKNNFLKNQSNGQSDEFKTSIAVVYSNVLNKWVNYVENIDYYQWDTPVSYFNYANEHSTDFWESISEKGLDSATENIFYPPYNVTKNFAHLCPAGANVWQHENDGECVKWTACSKGNMFSMIGVNSCNYSQNYTANLSLTNGSVFYPYNKIQNYETGALLNVGTDGIVQLGVLDSYETLYLSSATSDTKLLSNRFKLDEYNGNTVYDAMYNTSNGTRSGADWETDGIWNTLNGISHYTFNVVTGLFTILTSDNLFSYMALSWSESSISMMRTNFTAGIDNVSSKVPVLFLILIIVVILSVLAVLTIVFYALMNKVNSSSLGFLKGGI